MAERLEALLLDFDGTLVDSEPLHYEAWSAAVADFGAGVSWADYQRRFVGKTDVWGGETLLSEAGVQVTEALVAEVCQAKHRYYRSHAPDRLRISHETLSAIEELPSYLRLAIVSSSPAIDVEPTLEHAALGSRIEVRVYGDHVANHKPHPEPYHLAVERFSQRQAVRKSACVAFEDSDSGVSSAKAAGLTVQRVASPDELPKLLRAVLSLVETNVLLDGTP